MFSALSYVCYCQSMSLSMQWFSFIPGSWIHHVCRVYNLAYFVSWRVLSISVTCLYFCLIYVPPEIIIFDIFIFWSYIYIPTDIGDSWYVHILVLFMFRQILFFLDILIFLPYSCPEWYYYYFLTMFIFYRPISSSTKYINIYIYVLRG